MRRHIAATLACGAATALLASACGGSSSPSSASTQPPASSSTANATPPAAPSSAPQTPPAATPSVDPGTLPQTKVLPSATDPQFLAGVDDLWKAIVDDNPSEALPFFFPKSAYLQVKALANPGSDYQNRLIGFYDLDIHAAHQLLGSGAKSAQLVGVTVPANQAQWIPPGAESNKLPYYRVYGTRLTYTEGGKTKSFGLFSLISWRGQWYLVHFGPNPRPKPVGAVYQPRG